MAAGVILTGGESKRVGKDKAWLKLNSKALIEYVLERVREVASEVFLVGKVDPTYKKLGARIFLDKMPSQGPLGGLVTALSVSYYDKNIVVACDMPFLSVNLLNFLLSQATYYDVVVPETEKGFEPLCAVYSRRCLKAAEKALFEGKKNIISFYGEVDVKVIPEKIWRRYDEKGLSFFNINTMPDLEYARRIYQELQGGQE